MKNHTPPASNLQLPTSSTQNGNVLFFILIAVVLLGLLTMILSRGGSSVDQAGDYEQQSIKINEALRFAKGLETAVQQMLLNGISENDISFDNTTTANDYTNANCDDSSDRNYPACLIFDAQGAGLNYKAPPSGINDGSEWIITGALRITGMETDTASASASDLVLILPNVDLADCVAINNLAGVTNPSGAPPQDQTSADYSTHFTGSFTSGDILDPAGGETDGKESGCFEGGGTPAAGTYHFYHVLHAR
ncbi:MAG: hypothetical protein ACPGRX_03495 [Bdellovibrionales bacterium]